MKKKYKYSYNKITKEYTVTRDDFSSAPFSNLRDCKLSWKLLKNMKWSVNGKDWYNAEKERRIKDSTTKKESTN